MCVKVLLAEDAEAVRKALRIVLSECEDIALVGEAATGTIGLPNPNQRRVAKTPGFLHPYMYRYTARVPRDRFLAFEGEGITRMRQPSREGIALFSVRMEFWRSTPYAFSHVSDPNRTCGKSSLIAGVEADSVFEMGWKGSKSSLPQTRIRTTDLFDAVLNSLVLLANNIER